MSRIYYGWVIVTVALLANMMVVGATFSSFGLFVVPVSEDFGLSRADMNTALILMNFGSAAVSPVLGRLLDRYPARRIMQVCAALFGVSFAILALSHSLLVSGAVMSVPLAAATLGSASLTMTVLTARWFLAQRGRAMALIIVGMSLGSVLVAPAMGYLIESQGWRGALLTAAAVGTVLLGLLSLLVRDRPRADELEPGRAAAAARAAAGEAHAAPAGPAKVSVILRMPQFWSIALGAALAMGVAQSLMITIVPLALEEGLSMLQATSLVSITGGAAIGAKLLLAVVADKLDRVTVLTGLFALGAVMNLALMSSSGYPLLVGCAVILGVSTGALAPLFYTLLADRFGAASFGTVRGLAAPVTAIVGAVAVRYAGEIYDRTGGYDLMFATFVGAQLAAALLMFATRFTRPLIPVATPAAAHAASG